MTEDGKESIEPTEEVQITPEAEINSKIDEESSSIKLSTEDYSKYTEEELKTKINELMDKELEIRNKHLEKIRAFHPLRILLAKEIRTLATLKEEELTEDDKSRIKLATVRLSKHRYNGTDYSAKEKKKIKAKKRLVKASRKANR